jgi:hypothetical protein
MDRSAEIPKPSIIPLQRINQMDKKEIRPGPTSPVCLCLQYVINQEPFLSSLSTDMYKRDVGQEEECMTGRTLLVFDLLQLVQVHFAVGTQLR